MAIGLAVSRDGRSALLLIGYWARYNETPTRSGDTFAVEDAPGQRSRALVLLTGNAFTLADYDEWFKRFDPGLVRDVREEAALVVVGEHLDRNGPPTFTGPEGREHALLEARGEIVERFFRNDHPRAPDEEVHRYIAAKLYRTWKFNLEEATFTAADHVRLGVPQGTIERVAIAGEGKFWTRQGAHPARYRPTGTLLQDVAAGRFPGLERPPLFQVQEKLQAPRYAAACEHFSKAFDMITGERPDHANAAKEAVAALESLAKVITGKDTGTLDDQINELRKTNRIPQPLDQCMKKVWGYRSQTAGVGHGRIAAPAVSEAEGALVVNLSASFILFLLEIDAP